MKMKWSSFSYSDNSFSQIVSHIKGDLTKEFGRSKADLVFLFISAAYRDQLVDSWSALRREIPAKNVIGCTAGGIIGGDREIEDTAAVGMIACRLPKVHVQPFHLHQDKLPGSDGSPRKWRDLMNVKAEDNPQFIILSDPFSLDSEALVEGLDFAYPNAAKIGGLASGGTQPNENLLLFNEKAYHQGAIGVTLDGDIDVETVVAQGCRPIGEPLVITESEGQILVTLNNQPPVKYLSTLFEKLSARDKELLKTSLFLGISMDPFITHPKQGDFLIRIFTGLNMEKGIMAIGAPLRVGQTVQFHLRDSETSRDDLQLMLKKTNPDRFKSLVENKNVGAVLFSCLGRGKGLYGKSDHDTELFHSMMGHVPVAGFFCNGEIGPVGGRTYLHGYTSSIALFTPKKNTSSASTSTASSKEKK